ncbi:Fat storage-inducing transmembrane protein [Paraphysoderma sedebokerense]|nr:Fat storage-inducing transmembrane protein [Paraphysoderma sedebokerense]
MASTSSPAWRLLPLRPHQPPTLALPFFVLLVSYFSDTLSARNSPLPDILSLSSKHNPLNQYFVKIGWFWTTVLLVPFLLYTSFSPSPTSPESSSASPLTNRPQAKWMNAAKGLLRYLLATLYWFCLTQWFVGGIPILDRLYLLSGGACNGISQSYSETRVSENLTVGNTITISSYQCKKQGGKWEGGHDVSGHCLLLLHSVLVLREEIVLFIQKRSRNRKRIAGANKNGNGDPNGYHKKNDDAKGGKKGHDDEGDDYFSQPFTDANPNRNRGLKKFQTPLVNPVEQIFIYLMNGLCLLWIFMLFTTSLYFHNFFEKLNGSLAALLYWYIAYVQVFPRLRLW